jgi:BMFP domain-containing protein YqiC
VDVDHGQLVVRRMKKAREKFRELEERVKSLEAEVAQLKAAKPG